MVRNRGKKALYEVMSKARNKPGYGRTLEQMRPKRPDEGKSAVNAETSKATARWLRKPRIVQFNFGRIEFSIPYQLAIAIVLVLILLVLAAFRLGQEYYQTEQRTISTAVERQQVNRKTPIEREVADIMEPPPPDEDSRLRDIEGVKPIQPSSTGNNVIVVQQWGARPDLVPVQAHFAEYGIDTEIVMENGSYFLQTKNRYDNPKTPGTDGYKALQEIIKVGAKYKGKAPPTFETFALNFFSDAYGKKVK
ncbi:MAG: hypothetical protein WAV28_00600 [Sedimentisphaerales bacterium]|jgi:hypothetical protein